MALSQQMHCCLIDSCFTESLELFFEIHLTIRNVHFRGRLPLPSNIFHDHMGKNAPATFYHHIVTF